MRPLFVLARIVSVGCLWSIIFIEAVRVFMLQNWHFDIFWPDHWAYVWDLWSLGWVIDTPKEWAFVLLLTGFIPLWLTGWVVLSLLAWEKWIEKGLKYPFNLYHSITTPIKVATKAPVVIKKKSYKEIRPKGTRAPIYDYNETTAGTPKPSVEKQALTAPLAPSLATATPYNAPSSLKEKAITARETFSHSLFNMDDEEDDFDLDFDSIGKPQIESENEAKKTLKNIFDDEPAPKPSPASQDSDDDFDFNFDDLDKDEEQTFAFQAPKRTSEPKREPQENPRRENMRNTEKSNTRETARESRRTDNRTGGQPRNNRETSNNRQNARNFQVQNKMPLQQTRPINPVADILAQKGYDVLAGQTIRNIIVDFIGIAENTICLCLIDKEPGDWLADEERFNNEEPLWFSESAHRISPVRKVDLAQKTLVEKFEENGLDYDVKSYVVIQMGNIINAEDMFEIWQETGVEVTRINRGSPKEIKLFSKTIEEAQAHASRPELDTIRKIIRSAA